MPNYLRQLLRFQDPPQAPPQEVNITAKRPPEIDSEYLKALMAEEEPAPPVPRRRAMRAMPTRQQQTWADLIPQLLGGAADVATAYGGGRSDYQGRIMGLQQRQRDVSFEDALMARAAAEQFDREQETADWRDYSTKISSQDRRFNRGMKYAELDLMLKAMGKQREDQAKNDAFQKTILEAAVKDKVGGAGGRADLDEILKEGMKTAKSPEEYELLKKAVSEKNNELVTKEIEERDIDQILGELIRARMSQPGYSDPYGFGGMGLAAQLRPEAVRLAKERRKKAATASTGK